MRNSYGYNRKNTKAKSVRKIGKEINMTPSSVSLAIQVLIENGILGKTDKGEFYLVKNGLGVRETGHLQVSEKLDKTVRETGQSVRETGQPIYIRSKENLKERKKGEIPPSFEQIAAYCEEIRSPINPRKFFDFFSGTSWHKGNTILEDWQAEIILWGENEFKKPVVETVPKINPANRHFEEMALIKRKNEWHEFHTKGWKCHYCNSELTGIEVCNCKRYAQEFAKAFPPAQ